MKEKTKIIISVIITVIVSVTITVTASLVTNATNITYTSDKTNRTNVSDSLDELYDMASNGGNCSSISGNCDNVATPNLGSNNLLIPVIISDDGTVTKVSENNFNWYNYCNKEWANAVILNNGTTKEDITDGTEIALDTINSYFVWIPKYKYRLWNVESTTKSETALKGKHSIDIVFDISDTTDVEGSSCVTPMTSGETGACNNGEYMTHPAFISMGVDGFWVGKFETGYKGATSTSEAQVTSSDSSKIIVKPNSYSWRYNTIYNMFIASYNYNRDLDSHMMKNTEYGAVAYLSHSVYGINDEININNNSNFKTGYSSLKSIQQGTYPGTYGDGDSYNKPYNTNVGYLASTTGNISGIYDMSGVAWKYMSSYIQNNYGSSGFNASTIASYDSKYFDIYKTNSAVQTYENRILGDATGEMGPFVDYKDGDGTSRHHNNWYGDNYYFVESSNPWFRRGGSYNEGVLAGQFYFSRNTGHANISQCFRLVLAPN